MTTLLETPVSEEASAAAPGSRVDRSTARSSGGPTVGTVVGMLSALFGAMIGLQAITDNSFLTHLATGRLILTDGIPTADPYSITATGEPWVVQSWLASLLYAGVDAVAGPLGIRVLMALTTTVLAVLVWQLTERARTLVSRLVIVSLVMGVGVYVWSPRPLLFGLIGVAMVLLAAEERLDPRWLLPTLWLWANLHGSFPIGVAIAVAWWVGTRWSGRPDGWARRVLGWTGLGALAACISPLGPKLLVFPVQLLANSDKLSEVDEWQSPDFATMPARFFAVMVIVALFVLVRRSDRRDLVMVALALGLGLMASRNLAVASLILAPVLARGLGDIGSIRVDRPLGGARLAVPLLGVLAALLVVSSLQKPTYDLSSYPIRSLAWLEDQDLVGEGQATIATRDYVGNLETVLYGSDAGVFMDDRYDMYPADMVEDYVALAHGGGVDEILERRQVDVVVWDRGTPMADHVETSPDWGIVFTEDRWVVACRRPAPDVAPAC